MTRVRRIALWPLGSTLLVPASLLAGTAVADDGSLVAVTAAAILIALGAVGAVVTVRAIDTAESLSLRDPLTALPNRTLLAERIEQALRRARRSGEPFAVVILDLDGFKEVNDVRGHRAGDQALVAIARRLEDAVRESDTVARIGGDEFAVLSPGAHDEEQTAALAARLQDALRRPIEVMGVTVEIDASIGWAFYPDDGTTPEELLGRADHQMYATKRHVEGRPRRGSLDAGVVREFEAALDRGELVVHYQPIVRFADGAVRGIEALVRRADPERGVVGPAEFIPHVERTALIHVVTLHVATEALATVRVLGAAGRPLGVSINVPYRAIDDPGLVSGLERALREADIPPDVLTLELVPAGSGAGAGPDRDVLARLRALGIRLSIDDFGRASSLAAVRALPLDQVKIDAGFVRGLGRSPADAAVVQSLARLGHDLGLEVVAEGVETAQAWETALALGCDLAQGFHVSTPLPRAELAAWLAGGAPAELAS